MSNAGVLGGPKYPKERRKIYVTIESDLVTRQRRVAKPEWTKNKRSSKEKGHSV